MRTCAPVRPTRALRRAKRARHVAAAARRAAATVRKRRWPHPLAAAVAAAAVVSHRQRAIRRVPDPIYGIRRAERCPPTFRSTAPTFNG